MIFPPELSGKLASWPHPCSVSNYPSGLPLEWIEKYVENGAIADIIVSLYVTKWLRATLSEPRIDAFHMARL